MYAILKGHLFPIQKSSNFEKRLGNIWANHNFVWKAKKISFLSNKTSLEGSRNIKNFFEFYSRKLTTYTISLTGSTWLLHRVIISFEEFVPYNIYGEWSLYPFVHTYIHNWSLQPFSLDYDLVIPSTTYFVFVLILYMSGGGLKLIPDSRFLRNFSMAILLYFLSVFLLEICWETVAEEIFFHISFSWGCLT